MSPITGGYLFLLGLASGIALLALTAFRRVSPGWVQGLLVASGLLVLSRYLTMALFAVSESPDRVWALHRCWFASSLGLALPSVFALDQLVRHPAMTPKKLLIRFSPFLAAYGILLLFGAAAPVEDPVIGWAPRWTPPWRLFAACLSGTYVTGFVGLSALMIWKLPSRPIRLALLALLCAHLLLGLDGILLALGHWYVRPFLYSEMLTLVALWHAYETSRTTP